MVTFGNGDSPVVKNTSISLGPHFDEFVKSQIAAGRYGNASEVMRAGLRLLEEHEAKVQSLRRALIEGEESGDAGPLDFDAIKRDARAKARVSSRDAETPRQGPRGRN